MGKYLHKFDAVSDFQDAYYGEDYNEPWVSYTDEEMTRKIPTGFTSSVQSDGGLDLSGVFTYYGHAYQYMLDNETQTYKQSTNFVHIWTNGKVYVSPYGGLWPISGSDSRISRLDAIGGEIWTPGKMLEYLSSNSTRKVSEVYTEDVPANKVAYNKQAVYVTWDGTYDTETYSGVSVPNYVVDNARSTKNIFTEEFNVFVNDQLDAEWFKGEKKIARVGTCTYCVDIYQSDSDGLLHCGTSVSCAVW